MNERVLTMLTTLMQRSLGPWAEPVCARVARGSVGKLEGARSAKRMGLRWELDLNQNHERALYAVGSYEASSVRRTHRLLACGGAVLDVGANIGTFALPLAALGHSVVAVEAASDTAARLEMHVAENGLQNHVMIHQGALGPAAGYCDLRAGGDDDDSGLRTTAGTGRVLETVSVISGDELLQRLGVTPSVVKIDVEGGELGVLEGLSQCLLSVDAVIVEIFDPHQLRSGRSSTDIVACLREVGLEREDIRSDEPRPRLGRGGNNALFVKPHLRK